MNLKKIISILLLSLLFSNCKEKVKENKKLIDNHKNCIILDSIIYNKSKTSILFSKELALKVAEVYLKSTYGNSKINEQMPLQIENYQDSLWKISGTFYRPDPTQSYKGGSAEIILSKIDGIVLLITHYK